jgi:UDP-glucose 4-epimerase
MNGYADRRVLVIGGLGFIGGHLVSRLAAAGARTTVVTPARGRHAVAALEHERQGVSILEADIRDAAAMSVAVAGQDVVFNLSGQSGAVRSMEDPWTDLDVNCRGNLVLLEALRSGHSGAMMVFVGSRLQYGRPRRLPVTEDDTLEPLCLHAVHKSTVEEYLAVYRRLYGLRYAVARVTNPYGAGQPVQRTAYGVVNRMIHLALANRPLTIYGDGLQRRDYVYIDDVTTALMLLGVSERAEGRVYNVASGHGTPLVDLARAVIALAGGGHVEHVAWPDLAERIETGDFVADITRIKDELGWRPDVALHDGLERTVAFHRARVTP